MLNGKQRRKQFLIFLLLFGVSILPIVFVMYLRNQLVPVAVEYWQEENKRNKVAQLVEDERKKVLNDLKDSANKLSSLVVGNSSAIENVENDKKTQIEADLDDLKRKLDNSTNAFDEELGEVIRDLIVSMKVVNTGYGKGFEFKRKFEDCSREYKDFKIEASNAGYR